MGRLVLGTPGPGYSADSPVIAIIINNYYYY